MDKDNCSTVVVKKGSGGVVLRTQSDSYIRYGEALQSALTRNGTFMTFDAWRMALGKNNGWGQKVFFQTMKNLKFLCDNPNKDKKILDKDKLTIVNGESSQLLQGTYIPCPKTQLKYPELFMIKDLAYGFNLEALETLDDEILSLMGKEKDRLTKINTELSRVKAKLNQQARKLEKSMEVE